MSTEARVLPGSETALNAKVFDVIIEAGLVFLIVFTPFAFGTVEVWAYTVMEMTVLLLVAVWLLKMILVDGGLRIPETPVNTPVILFICLVLFQMLSLPEALLKIISPGAQSVYSETGRALNMGGAATAGGTVSLNAYATGVELVKIFSYLGVFFLIGGNITSKRQVKRLLTVVIVTGFAVALFGLIQNLTWNGRLYWTRELTQGGNPFGPFVNKNNFAGYIVMIIPLSLGMFLAKRDNGMKALFGFMAVVMASALFLSLSRGGMFAFIGAIAVMGGLLFTAKYEGGYKRGLLLFGAFLVPLILYLLYIGIDPVVDRLATLGDKETYLREGRWAVWGATASIVGDYPIFGSGLDTFEAVFPAYQPLEASNVRWRDAHNDYLQFTAETGTAGVVIALTFFGLIFKNAFSALGSLRGGAHNYFLIGLISSVVGFLLSIIFTFNTHIPANAMLFVVILAMVVKMSDSKIKRTKREEKVFL